MNKIKYANTEYTELENGTRLYECEWNEEVYEASESKDGIHYYNNGKQYKPVYEQEDEPAEECARTIGFEEV